MNINKDTLIFFNNEEIYVFYSMHITYNEYTCSHKQGL